MTRWFALAVLASCSQVVAFEDVVESGVQCVDGIDNDGDAQTDCEDAGCAIEVACNGCGNGVMDPGEQCDDGNALPDDGCSPSCTRDVGCGIGVMDPGEACDDGNTDDTDACVACAAATCGDGKVRSGSEQCDDGNTDDTDTCPTTCDTAVCGDGFAQAGVDQCDDGNTAANDGCASCVIERCGDGTTQTGAVITAIDFEWLVTSCTAPRRVEFQIGNTVGLSFDGDPETCTCEPAAGFVKATVTDPGALAAVVNGLNDFKVDYSGPGHFLAWALVTVHGGATSKSFVVYEGAPGAALSRATSLCGGGFDENVAPQTAAHAVSVFEDCDDGNDVDSDGCTNSCKTGGGE